MKPAVLRNLTMASAKHLLNAGHITAAHHSKIMKKVAAPAAPQTPGAMAPPPPAMKMQAGAPSPAVPMGALDARQPQGAGHYMGSMPTGPGDTSEEE